MPGPPPHSKCHHKKNVTKKSCFFIFSFFLHLRVQQYTRTTTINNNIDDQEARAPSIRFCQLIEKGFVVKVATLDPHLTFL